jgi:hypothetical protein
MLSFEGYAVSGYGAGGSRIISAASENWTASAQGAYLRFDTTPKNSTVSVERLRIDHNGFLGVATTTPSMTLTARLGVDGNIGFTNQGPAPGVAALNDAANAWVPVAISANANVYLCSASGNVGIGTTAPADKLDVSGNIKLGSTSNDGVIGFGSGGLATAAGIYVGRNRDSPAALSIGGFAGTYFHTNDTWNAPTTPKMVLIQNGFVGIGTTAPHAGLAVKGGIQLADTNGLSMNMYYSGGWVYETTGVGAATIGLQAQGLSVYAAPSGTGGASANAVLASVLTFNPNSGVSIGANYSSGSAPPASGMIVQGNVGIGCVNPNTTLELQGWGANPAVLRLRAGTNLGTAGQSVELHFFESTGAVITGIHKNGTDSNSQIGQSFFNYNSGLYETVRFNGAGNCLNLTGVWTTFSDASIKQDVTPYTRGLDAVLALNPVQFRYRPGTFGAASADEPSPPRFGLIAGDVKPHVPEIVGTTTGTVGKQEGVELATLESGNLIYTFINAFKELKAEIEAMKAGQPAPTAREQVPMLAATPRRQVPITEAIAAARAAAPPQEAIPAGGPVPVEARPTRSKK